MNKHAQCVAVLAAGKKYKNDPTILAWNLINEPRCETWVDANSWCPATLAEWFKVGLAQWEGGVWGAFWVDGHELLQRVSACGCADGQWSRWADRLSWG
jgi:hypothetical protein